MKSKITARQFVLILVAVILSTVVANYDKLLPHRWQTYTAPNGIFSIELPGTLTAETTQAPIEGGGSMTINLISASPTTHTSYSCAYFDREGIENKSLDEVLTSARDGSLRKIQGTIIKEKRIEVDGYPALEMQANARGTSLFDSRIIVAGKRLYMIGAVATVQGDREPKTVQRVMDSFKILQK